MKIAVFSDLHIEFSHWEPSQEILAADVVILAGDIHNYKKVIPWITETFKQPVIFVPGNHEFYGGNIQSISRKLKRDATNSNVSVLNNDIVKIGDVTFIGSTLWTDFNLLNDQANCAYVATRKLVDFNYIRYEKNGRFLKITAQNVISMHEQSLEFVQKAVKEATGKIIVISHHAPSLNSIQPSLCDDLSAAFASNLDSYIADSRIKYWVHGHTHYNTIYKLGDTQIVTNQRGYLPEEPAEDFINNLMINI
ncbi:MAG: phosphoesterase [Colwellia sp.]|nr:phosphoesterase [Colwellia sp.]